MNDKKYTVDEIYDIIDDMSYLISDTYFEKMEMRDIALLSMFILLLKKEFKSEENDVNK